jgi:hypothetical protein
MLVDVVLKAPLRRDAVRAVRVLPIGGVIFAALNASGAQFCGVEHFGILAQRVGEKLVNRCQ